MDWELEIKDSGLEYSNLFSSFTLFLNCFHFTFGYKLVIGSKTTSFMEGICDSFPFI